jgi:hypothetical protein
LFPISSRRVFTLPDKSKCQRPDQRQESRRRLESLAIEMMIVVKGI